MVNAVLPSSTGWGFQLQPSQQSASVSFGLQSAGSACSSKRKLSFPEPTDMDCDDDRPASPNKHDSRSRPNRPATSHRIKKRAKVHTLASRPLSVTRMVETMDKAGLENLISTLCQSHPELAAEVATLAPKVTVNSALHALNKKLDAVFLGLPYKGDHSGDYAYLRVKPLLEDLLATMSDYMSHFLPPNEQQISNSLAFLDGCTALLHKLPAWTNPNNNHPKNSMYSELTQGWIMALAAASEESSGLGLAYRGWEQKLVAHNEVSGDKLGRAVETLKKQMSSAWPQQQQQQASPFFSHSVSAFQPAFGLASW